MSGWGNGDAREIGEQVEAIANVMRACSDEQQGVEAARQLRTLALPYRQGEDVRGIIGASEALRAGLLRLLEIGSDTTQYWCCHCIVSISHKHFANQRAIATHPGMMDAILKVLVQGCPLSKGAACSALVESTFRNEANALLVAKTPGMMHGVVAVMQSSAGDIKDDAAGVLRNCSNYSSEATEVIVRSPGVLDALVEMCKGEHKSDRFTAMGTIQNLTRCSSVVPLLTESGVLDALIPALNALGSGEQHDVMRAEALMAVTNLSSEGTCQVLESDPSVLGILTQMVSCAIRGEAWRDVAWYDAEECITPMCRLSLNKANRAQFRHAGIIEVLGELLTTWLNTQESMLPEAFREDLVEGGGAHAGTEEGGDVEMVLENWDEMSKGDEGMEDVGQARRKEEGAEGAVAVWEKAAREDVCLRCVVDHEEEKDIVTDRDMRMAVVTLVNLSGDTESYPGARKEHIPLLLRGVHLAVSLGAGQQCHSSSSLGNNAAELSHLWVLRDRHFALAMSHHSRLGANSLLSLVDQPILWLIMAEASTVDVVAMSLADELDKAEELTVTQETRGGQGAGLGESMPAECLVGGGVRGGLLGSLWGGGGRGEIVRWGGMFPLATVASDEEG